MGTGDTEGSVGQRASVFQFSYCTRYLCGALSSVLLEESKIARHPPGNPMVCSQQPTVSGFQLG